MPRSLLFHKFVLIPGVLLLSMGVFVYHYQTIDVLRYAPALFSLPVPFTTQAPDGVWENNANCEEASALMANAYLTGDTQDEIPPHEAKPSLDDLVSWEQSNLGYSIDTGASEIGEMIKTYFHFQTGELTNFTADDLKKELLQDHVLILPVNLKLLGNLKYQGTGEDYHVIVIRGYAGDTFFVNDPGTTNGRNNFYSFATLQNAAADWDSTHQKLNPDKKVVLVVWK